MANSKIFRCFDVLKMSEYFSTGWVDKFSQNGIVYPQ